MNELKLVISDIDGTLTRGDKTLSEGVVAAVKRLTDAGVMFSLISARPPSGMLWIAEKLGLTTPIGAFNGGTIVGGDGQVQAATHVPRAAATQVLALIDQPGIVPWVFADGVWHAARPDNVHDLRERQSANQEPVFGSDFTALLDKVDKIVAVTDDTALMQQVEDKVFKAVGDQATVVQSQTYYLDITAQTANKGDGVAALAKAYGVSLDQIAVIGDQRNDLAMFARAGLSIAMGQGPEEVRKAATHVTGSNDEDGVAQAIDQILLPMVR